MYQFKSDKPFGRIDKYYVLITPNTHKIYEIWAEAEVSDEQGSKDQDTLMQMVEQKYGAQPKDENSLGDFDRDTRHYRQGTRGVMTRIHRFTKPILEIRYIDYTLNELADKEKAETTKQKAKTIDSSNL